jgi:hypothetical protein
MGDNIVRRGPAGKVMRRHERGPTTEMGTQQLHDLIREHKDPHVDLEPELELVDAARDAPSPSPGVSAPRLAHTLRRGAVLAMMPAPRTQDDRPDTSTIEMPRLDRTSEIATTAIPRLDRATGHANGRTTGAPTNLSPEPGARRAAEARLAEARLIDALRALPPAEDAERVSNQLPRAICASTADEPIRPTLRDGWRSRLILITLLVVLVMLAGAVSVLLRAIL